MVGSVFIMLTTWVGFTGQMYDVPIHYQQFLTFESRHECENKLKEYFAGENGYRLETIKTERNEIVLRVVSGTSAHNTFVTCLEVGRQ